MRNLHSAVDLHLGAVTLTNSYSATAAGAVAPINVLEVCGFEMGGKGNLLICVSCGHKQQASSVVDGLACLATVIDRAIKLNCATSATLIPPPFLFSRRVSRNRCHQTHHVDVHGDELPLTLAPGEDVTVVYATTPKDPFSPSATYAARWHARAFAYQLIGMIIQLPP